METLKNLTLVQWIGIMIGLNSLLMGATPQLTVLFGTAAVPIIVAVATLGNGALGVFVTVIGGLGSQARNVVAGGASIAVGPNASASLATLAMDPAQSKIDAAPGAGAAVAAIAKSAAVLLFAVILATMAFAPTPAAAQTRSTTIIGTALNSLAKLVQDDGTASVKLSTSIPELQDYVGEACWTQIALIGKVVKAHPIPPTFKIATDIEALRLVGMSLNKICGNPNCGQMWTDAQNVANAINPGVLPVSLPSICSKIPVIGTLPQSAVTAPAQSAVPAAK